MVTRDPCQHLRSSQTTGTSTGGSSAAPVPVTAVPVAGGGHPLLFTSEMQSVAKRIEERCREREREREALSVARDAEVEVDRELRAASEAHQRARVAFLETVLEVHDAELGFHRRQMEKRQCVKDESRHTEWDGIIEAQIAELEASWRAEQAAMAAAVTKREAYLGWIQGAIQDVQEAQAKRKRKKELLKEHGDWLVERWNEATREADRKREEIRALRAEEANLKLRVQQVADQVRAELAKRTELRRTHREAQRAYCKANDDTFVREGE